VWGLTKYCLLITEYTAHTKVTAFTDDLLLLMQGQSIKVAENNTNVKMAKIPN
jgi:hypothetical protein